MKIIIFIIFILYIVCFLYEKHTTFNNIKRHLTNEYHFAHFSKIDTNNYYLTPSLLFTTPIKLNLKTGQSLWIPKGWWHWIETPKKTIAINFWSTDINNRNKPCVINNTFQKNNLKNKIINILKLENKIDIWNSKTNNIICEKYNNKQIDNHYIISLSGYKGTDKLNNKIYQKIIKNINIPNFFKNKSNVDVNFWISLGYHDTGLHYDDYNGLLCVLDGEKNITLYPPSDSYYLKPFDVLPEWAKIEPVKFEYNTYTFIEKLNPNNNFPSSRLLYESMLESDTKHNLQLISSVIKKISGNKIVWGCKLTDGIMRWELYMYHYGYYPNIIRNKNTELINFYINNNNNNQKQIEKYNKIVNNNNDLIIHSFDIFKNNNTFGDDIHLYYKKKNTTFKLPFYGSGTTLKINGEEHFESIFVFDTQKQFILHFDKYIKYINSENSKQFKYLLELYQCDYIAIWKKNNTQLFIQYLGISINDFIHFIKTYNYPDTLLKHVTEYKNMYTNILHEITIVFDKKTKKPVRTAFYGLL